MFVPFFATIGIMSAMSQEAETILNAMTNKETFQLGNREFTKGQFEGIPIIFSLAGIGKVAAATTATLLAEKFKVSEIIFTGVAGGGQETNIGDVVIGSSFLQHDLDLRPLFPQFYIYSLEKQLLQADPFRVLKMQEAAARFLTDKVRFPELGISAPRIHIGTILSGDQFIGSISHHNAILDQTREVLPSGFHAIEMEGAAVAQVCTELQIPFTVLRAISDKADHEASVDFPLFLNKVASQYSLGILREYCLGLIKHESSETLLPTY